MPEWDARPLILRTPPCLDGARLAARRRPAEACPVIDGVDGAVPPKGMRRSLEESRRRLATFGAATFEEADETTADTILDHLLDLHVRRWRERDGGVLAHPSFQAFHREATRGLACAGLLRLTLMRIAGTPAAVFHGFASGRAVFYYIGGFDPAFAPASPGNLVVGREIERAAADGFARFDVLKGAEPYKYRRGAVDRPRHAVDLSPSGEPAHARRTLAPTLGATG